MAGHFEQLDIVAKTLHCRQLVATATSKLGNLRLASGKIHVLEMGAIFRALIRPVHARHGRMRHRGSSRKKNWVYRETSVSRIEMYQHAKRKQMERARERQRGRVQNQGMCMCGMKRDEKGDHTFACQRTWRKQRRES